MQRDSLLYDEGHVGAKDMLVAELTASSCEAIDSFECATISPQPPRYDGFSHSSSGDIGEGEAGRKGARARELKFVAGRGRAVSGAGRGQHGLVQLAARRATHRVRARRRATTGSVTGSRWTTKRASYLEYVRAHVRGSSGGGMHYINAVRK